MLRELAIRDIILIETLDLNFGAGLSVLTGETGAGKSILLDSLGLALGGRASEGLVRAGAERGSVAARFDLGSDHPARPLLEEQGISEEEVEQQLDLADAYARGLIADDMVVCKGIRFRIDKLVTADRGLARFFRYCEQFPKAHPGAARIR